MRIPLPHLVVAGLTITAAGLAVLTPWLVVVGAMTLTVAAVIALLNAPMRRGGQSAAGPESRNNKTPPPVFHE